MPTISPFIGHTGQSPQGIQIRRLIQAKGVRLIQAYPSFDFGRQIGQLTMAQGKTHNWQSNPVSTIPQCFQPPPGQFSCRIASANTIAAQLARLRERASALAMGILSQPSRWSSNRRCGKPAVSRPKTR